MNKKRAIVVFSGGPDSTAALMWALSNGYDPKLVTFQFTDKKQDGELYAAMTLAKYFGLTHKIVDIKSLLYSGLTSDIVIMMHGKDRESTEKKDQYTFAPFGAGMILSIISSLSLFEGIDTIVWGATANDGKSNPQYSQAFCDDLSALINKYTKYSINIIAPISNLTKSEIIAKYYTSKEDLFAMTWSCAAPGNEQCGICHPCLSRRTSALSSGINDTSQYINIKYTPLRGQDESNCPGA
jgi:7-cyano-7-deazaguanine synthase